MANKLKQLLIVAILLCSNLMVNAAVPNDNEVLPIDPRVKTGVLPNGLTYFVVHNEEPKNRVNFYISQKVGSILENDDQRGLAHFLEHMAFNGTEHFPGKNLLEYLQNNGIEFGRDINAATGFDATNYMIKNVDSKNTNLCDSVLLALYDWGNEISLLEKEIESERGVIHEEWRTGGDATHRMWEKVLPEIYPNCKYAHRLPIGTMEVVMNFKPKTIREYYEKWYRPDQQGIIVVGDINVEDMEKKIINLFSKSEMPKNPAKREYVKVPDNNGILYSLFTDPEMTNTLVYMFFKHELFPEEKRLTMEEYRYDLNNVLSQIMLGNRFQEVAQKADSPFMGAFGYDGTFFVSPTKGAYNLIGISKQGQAIQTFETMLREIRRVMQHGFTQGELDRAKADYAVSAQNAYNERNKVHNNKWGDAITNYFTDKAQLVSPEFDLQMVAELLPNVTLNDVNNFISSKISDDNVVLIISGPKLDATAEQQMYPTKEQINESFAAIIKEHTEAYVDQQITEPLVAKEPVAGTIVKESYDKSTDITTLVLSNGATVRLKKTDFKNDEITMNAISLGGKNYYKGQDVATLKFASEIASISAIGAYTRTNLAKLLAGKNVSTNFSLDYNDESVNSSCGVKDIETMFQLQYALFTDIRPDEESYNALIAAYRSQLPLVSNDPNYVFADSVSATRYKGNPLYRNPNLKELDQLDYNHVLEVVRDRLSNAGDYTFNIVGNFEMETIKPLILKYIASLPDNGRRENADNAVKGAKGTINNTFSIAMENPKTSVFFSLNGDLKFSVENNAMLKMFSNIMDINYTKTIREEEGGTYGVGTGANVGVFNDQWVFIYQFDTNVESQERLNKRAQKELFEIMQNGVDASAFAKVKENMIKNHETAVRTNGYWRGVLETYVYGYDKHTGYEEMIKDMTKDKLDKFLKSIYNNQNKTTVIMNGVAKK